MLCKVTELLCGLNFSNEANQIKLSGKRKRNLEVEKRTEVKSSKWGESNGSISQFE